MKNTFKILVAVLAIGFAVPAMALDDPVNAWSVGSTNKDTTLSYAIVSARSANNGTPVLQYLNSGSDVATGTVRFGKVINEITATHTNSTTTIFVNTTNPPGTAVNFKAGTIIIRHMIDDSYEKRTLANNTGSTNIVVTAASLGEVRPGDKIYYVTTNAATILQGAATNSLNASGGALFVGQKGKPLLIEVNATTAGTINVASGVYLTP